jgi:glycosyltransferase involved in cell wall biosynthesis
VRILFFTHYFPPEVNAPASRTYEHCRAWVKAGHEVHVVTCVPSHPFGKPFEGFRRCWYRHDEVDGIHVHRVWTYLAANRGVLRRTVNYLSFIPTAALCAWRLGRFDVAVGTSPQFFCAVATWLYARVRQTPWVFELRDLWPESIPAVGAMRRSLALRCLERLELRMYRDATAIVCLTEAFVRALRARGIEAAKLHWIPNGIEPSLWQATDRDAVRARLGVRDDDVVACYVGTIGMAHGLDTLVSAGGLLCQRAPRVRILIVGDGAELPALRELAARAGLGNLEFTGLVPREQVPGILAAADIALVTLRPSAVFRTVLPSKMFEAMAASRPVVLAVEGEARTVLDRAGAGIAVEPGNAAALAATIARLASDEHQRARMGLAGARFVAREFSRPVWATRYLTLLSELAVADNVTRGAARGSGLGARGSGLEKHSVPSRHI